MFSCLLNDGRPPLLTRHEVKRFVVPPVNIRHSVAATCGTCPQDVRKHSAALSFLVSYGRL